MDYSEYFQLDKISRSTLATSNWIVRVFQKIGTADIRSSLRSLFLPSFSVPCIATRLIAKIHHPSPYPRPHASSYWHWIWRRNDTIYRGRWTCKPWFTTPMKRDGLENRVRFSAPVAVLVNRLNCFENASQESGEEIEEIARKRVFSFELTDHRNFLNSPFRSNSSDDKPKGAKSVW